MLHAALLLWCLGPVTTVTPFHHQPEAQHPKSFSYPTTRRPITPSIGPFRHFAVLLNLVASLIGRFGSSAFRLSTSAVSMSLAGSRFSSDSAPGPFHYGIPGRGGTTFWTAFPRGGPQGQRTQRTHLIHHPARDIIPPRGGARVFSYRM